jgi:hypothetical protein
MHRVIAVLICILLVPAMAWGHGDASDWDLTGHNEDSYDLYFVIKKCN